MGRSTPKSTKAVPVPLDGTVLWFATNDSSLPKEDIQDGGVRESLELLSLVEGSISGSDEQPLEIRKTPSQRLWSALTTANLLRAQLQALQAFRSTILQGQGEIMEQHELVGTYRLLIEWAISVDLPTPLRRAIHSSLETLSTISTEECYRIREHVIQSVFDGRHWTNPPHVLFEVLNYEAMRDVIVQDVSTSAKTLSLLAREASTCMPILEEYSFHNPVYTPSTQMSRAAIETMEKSVEVATTLKLFLTPVLSNWNESRNCLSSQTDELQLFLWRALICRGMSADGLNMIGVAYGQTLLFEWKCRVEGDTSSWIAQHADVKVKAVTEDESLPPLNVLAAIQGITATLPNNVLVWGSPPLFSDPLGTYLLRQCRDTTGAAARLSALRGLHTLINRCRSFVTLSLFEHHYLCHIKRLADDALDIALQAWESPPGRQVASAVPGLFKSLIGLMRTISSNDEVPSTGALSDLKGLVKQVLGLPPNRKVRSSNNDSHHHAIASCLIFPEMISAGEIYCAGVAPPGSWGHVFD